MRDQRGTRGAAFGRRLGPAPARSPLGGWLDLRSWAAALAAVLAAHVQRNAVSIPCLDLTSGLFAFFVPVALGNALFGPLRLRAVDVLGAIDHDAHMMRGPVLFTPYTVARPDSFQNAHSPGRMLSLMMAAAGVVGVGTAVHLLVERPMLRLGRTLVPIDGVQAGGPVTGRGRPAALRPPPTVPWLPRPFRATPQGAFTPLRRS